MELSTRKKVEIEIEFAKALNDGKTRRKVTVDAILDTDSLIESSYILDAFQMPIEEISKEIERL